MTTGPLETPPAGERRWESRLRFGGLLLQLQLPLPPQPLLLQLLLPQLLLPFPRLQGRLLIAGGLHILLIKPSIPGAVLGGATLDLGVPGGALRSGGAEGFHQRLGGRLGAGLGGCRRVELTLWAAAPEVVAAPEPVAVPEALLTFCLGGSGDGGGAALLNCCLTGGVVLAGLYGAAEPASARIGPANVTMVSTALALIHFRCRAMGASQS